MSHVEEMAACERLLEFAYDELAGEEAEKFRTHLESCAKCRTELDGIRRVRGAVKAALPVMEPPEAASGALHAQLLHAAALRRPVPRGKLLLFARKVMQHPAYAAAAMFLLVGGAVGVEWSRGRLFMPEPQLAQNAPVAAPATEGAAPTPPAEVPPPAPPPAVTATANPAPAAAEPQAANESAGRFGALGKSAPVGASGGAYELERAKAKDALEGAQQKTRYYLDTKGDGRPMEVQLAPPHAHASAKKTTRQGGPGAATRSDAVDGLMLHSGGHATTGSPRGYRGGASDKNWNGESNNRAIGGAPPSTPYATAPAQPEAPAPAPAARPSVDDRAVTQTLAGEGKVAEHRAHGTAKAERSAAVVPKAAAPTSTSSPDSLRKRAVEAAGANRCDEAIRLYQELERSYPRYRIAPRDRLGYVRCLRASGREQQALDELNAVEPNLPARKRREAPPAQRAEEKAPAPAKAAPPSREADQEAASTKKKSAKPAATKPAAAAPAAADTPSY